MTRTRIYTRVSSKEQAADGASLPVQANESKAFCDAHGLQLGTESNYRNPGVFADPGVSAWKVPLFERPGFRELWLSSRRGDNIVFLSFDRAFRSVMDFSNTWPKFEAAGITPIFVRERIDMRSATGRLMANMCASFAQFKSDLISQRVREANGIKKQRAGTPKKARLVQQGNPQLAKLAGDMNDVLPLHSLDIQPGRVFGYARVSTGNQKTDSQMAGVQSTTNRLLGEGYTDAGLFQDQGVSAFSVDWKDRPAGSQLWAELQPNDAVVVSRLDRVFRSVHDMANTTKTLLDRGIHIVTGCGLDTRTPFGRQGLEILTLLAAWESRDLSWRLKLAFAAAKKLKGKWLAAETLPRWMKKVEVNGTHWTAHPDFFWIRQYQELEQMLETGMPAKQAADFMEERNAATDCRPLLPPLKFNPIVIRRRLKRHNEPGHLVDGYDRWCKRQTPDKNGELERDWSWERVRHAKTQFSAIEKLLS
ncbi:MAG: recombinase family protein [Fuerstiella sp.]|nr:recombinase family protein [Fuerstiella sp.]